MSLNSDIKAERTAHKKELALALKDNAKAEAGAKLVAQLERLKTTATRTTVDKHNEKSRGE